MRKEIDSIGEEITLNPLKIVELEAGADVTSSTAMFVAVVDPETRISFLFTRCRHLSIFLIC